jgi:hypothetical protein
MEIRLDKRAVKTIRLSTADAIEEGDTETLREDIIDAFSDEQIEEIERRIDSADFYDFISEILDEWSGEDADELFELIEAQLADAGVDLKYHSPEAEEEEEEDDEDEDEDEEEDDEDEDEEEDDLLPVDEEAEEEEEL